MRHEPKTELRITRMSCLNRATDLACNGKIDKRDIIKVSEMFADYVYNGIREGRNETVA